MMGRDMLCMTCNIKGILFSSQHALGEHEGEQ